MLYDDGMTQPSYSQNSYTSPGTSPQPPSTLPQYQSTAAYPPGYPPAYSPEPITPEAAAYPPTASPYALAEPPKKSPVLGILGFAMVVICGIVFFACTYAFFNATFDVLGTAWIDDGTFDTSTLTDSQLSAISPSMIGLMLSSAIGLAGLIISIVAAVQNKARVIAVIGIILGVIAPFTSIIAAYMSMANYGMI